jgi:hypothetical protein
MCRNIKTLHNFAPPATEDEVRAAALQFVRKLSGTTHPSKANLETFDAAVERVTAAAKELLEGLVTTAPPRDREAEAAAAKARSAKRFGERRAGAVVAIQAHRRAKERRRRPSCND